MNTQEALREYKTEGYEKINEALRNDYIADEVEVLDSAMSHLTEAAVLYRGTDFYSMDMDEDEDYTGEIVTDLAYMSTTRKRNLAAGKFYRGLLLEIEVPAGILAVEPDEILFENEAEVILARGLELEVINDNCDYDQRVMKVRVVA